MDQSAAWLMIRRRAAAAGIHAPIGNHTMLDALLFKHVEVEL